MSLTKANVKHLNETANAFNEIPLLNQYVHMHIGHHWHSIFSTVKMCGYDDAQFFDLATNPKVIDKTTTTTTKYGYHCLQMKRTKFDSRSRITTVKNHRLNDFHYRVTDLNNATAILFQPQRWSMAKI